ncbi:isoleucine--tRNA ligase [Candidatus Phytoplasma pini]|uniref:Isoleucine--tRNA ligase n=1 Tax=Candidatus Phytoplasma pini TaxID=267362 RepID=A0A559KJ87_9MOLU|nr:isoleucine--tRNA ligase [Candidatus Phytoplasma pini]TVY12158.1 Isoleucyl-tRNA synthetase [Candidatus Phytoplasma pini]
MNKNYKDTLIMPYTSFPMKGNLNQKEIEIEQNWENINLYKKNLNKNNENLYFWLHDGPPYANGNIHIGHALNKILKDFILRFKNMQGFYAPYIPGWDTHGLPIELSVTKTIESKEISRKDFIEKCKQKALFFIEKQKKSFRRLGILGEWEQPYLTFDNSFVADQIRIFSKMVDKKLIFKKLKPIYWSPFLKSVLAESEIEYKNHKSPSIFIKFPIINEGKFQNVNLLIWTTTPWTLPANVAICVHPERKYNLIQFNKTKYIVGNYGLKFLQKNLNWKEIEILDSFLGNCLENLIYENNIFKKKGKIILDTFVLENEGTGLVHIAPGHGYEDFLLSEKYNLEIICSVDKKGFMTEIAGIHQGIFYEKANNIIIEDLKKNNLLVHSEFINHSYPHDNRTHNPIILLAIPQWFMNIKKIKNKLIKEIKTVKWFPKWGEIKMHNMIEKREDWVISRQRLWGVPIPIFYTKKDEPILDVELINHVADLFEKYGKDIWYQWDCKDLLPKNYPIDKITRKETDIIDVWFDSGTSYSIMKKKFPHFISANVYLEGSDQYRGWFNSSLITSVAVYEKTPYKQIITHGFVLDGLGQKMSKSINNVIDPLDIVKKKGADILRLWVANVNYNIDVKIDQSILKQIEEKYRKIRNTIRFMLGNLNNFDPRKINHYIPFEKRKIFHQLLILEFKEILFKIIESYENYDFEKIMSLFFPFISNKISAFYLDLAKDILYIEKENNFERRIIQSNIYDLLMDFLIILTPIIPHTTSEAYQTLFFKTEEDIYLERIPKKEKIQNWLQNYNKKFYKMKKSYQLFFELREMVLKKLEEARNNKIINKSLQAQLILDLTPKYIQMLNDFSINKKLHQLLIVSKIEIKENNSLNIEIKKAEGSACPRCWNIIQKKKTEDLCKRCSLVVERNKKL